MSKPFVLCIAGGSGSGKSTLADGLFGMFGERASLLALDEYQKKSGDVPRTSSGRPNYDHPDAVDFQLFVRDLAELRAGRDIQITRRHKRLTMDGGVAVGETVIIESRPLIIVEGYLALRSESARPLYDFSVFLDLSDALRVARRRWAKDADYVEQVLLPMHATFVEPTKRFANLVVDVSECDCDEVLRRVRHELIALGVE